MESIQKRTSLSKDAKNYCAQILAKAFLNYPLYAYGINDKVNQEKKLCVLFQTLVEFTSRYGAIYTVGDPFKAVMLVLPSTQIPISNWKMFLSGATDIFFKVGLNYLLRQREITQKQEEIHLKYMTEPHQYIFTIGVDPAHQGQKLASRLIQELQQESEKQHCPIFLETNKAINVQIYQKLGFKVLEMHEFPKKNLTLWGMRWDPSKKM